MTSTNNNQNINPKSCVYNCNTQIYWNTSENTYFEVFSKKKHICPNRLQQQSKPTIFPTTTKPNYYSKKPWNTIQPKPKMSNSFELLTGPIDAIQKKYELLSDLVTEHGGKTHGSQSHNVANNSLSLIVYYEVPLGMRDEVKQKFNNMIRNQMNLQR